MRIGIETLEDRHVRLEPLEERHRQDLRAACAADPDIWPRLYSLSMIGEAFDPRFELLLAGPAAGGPLPFAVVVDGRVGGITAYLDVQPDNAALEIGHTYYAPELRGGTVNPACKRLLLAHAFASGARRACFRVDALNGRSRRAVEKLGAVLEGVLRQDRVVWTGRVRDTAVYSILAAEWPAVRDRLDARLAGNLAPDATTPPTGGAVGGAGAV